MASFWCVTGRELLFPSNIVNSCASILGGSPGSQPLQALTVMVPRGRCFSVASATEAIAVLMTNTCTGVCSMRTLNVDEAARE